MMHLAEYLLRWTGDASYADYWERNLYNGALAQQHPETGMVTYFLPMRSGSTKKWGTPTDDFWCCQGTLIQAHAAYPHHIFYEDGQALVLSQYIPCQLDWHANGERVSLRLSEGSQPESHRRPRCRSYELQIDCAEPLEFPLKFRLPWWMNASPDISINGEKRVVAGNPSTYAQVHQVWHHDKVQITLPYQLAASPLPDLPDTVAFMEGPVVLAAVLGNRTAGIAGDTFNESTLYYKKEADPASILIPDNEREFTHWKIEYRTRDQAKNLRFIPLYEIRDEAYAVYFPIRNW
jgi:DUF1680 family protein